MSGGARQHPTSEGIARALLTAADLLGELPALRRYPTLWMLATGRRCQWHVLAALDAAFPNLPMSRKARWLGFRLTVVELRRELGVLRGRSWWREDVVSAAFICLVWAR